MAVAVWHCVSSAKGVVVTVSFHHTWKPPWSGLVPYCEDEEQSQHSYVCPPSASAIRRVDIEDGFLRADTDADASTRLSQGQRRRMLAYPCLQTPFPYSYPSMATLTLERTDTWTVLHHSWLGNRTVAFLTTYDQTNPIMKQPPTR